jgi:hypothetical protein
VAKPDQLRTAYLPSRRVRFGSDTATLCAVAVLVGLLGMVLTWWDRSPLFDLASNTHGVAVKMGTGYLVGPILILVTLPLVFGSSRQVALKRLFRARLMLAAALWIAGLSTLVAKVSDLEGYTLEAGTYITGGLLVVGLLATLAMWPKGLEVVMVDRKGGVRESGTDVATPRTPAHLERTSSARKQDL